MEVLNLVVSFFLGGGGGYIDVSLQGPYILLT